MKKPFKFKQFQREDYARAALHYGIILGHDTGLGKTLGMFVWPLLKCGLQPETPLRPALPTLLVVPGDGHDQTDDEALRHFGTRTVRLRTQEDFLRLAKLDPITGRRVLAADYYLTSYTQLTGNGVADFPELDLDHPRRTLASLNLGEADAEAWWANRGQTFATHYTRLGSTPEHTSAELRANCERVTARGDDTWVAECRLSLALLLQLTPDESEAETQKLRNGEEEEASPIPTPPRRFSAIALADSPAPPSPTPPSGWHRLNARQKTFAYRELAQAKHREFRAGIGESRSQASDPSDPSDPSNTSDLPSSPALPPTPPIRCLYSPSLADLVEHAFPCIVVDEGTKIKGDHTIIGTGVRQIQARYRLVLTATPIKNRFPDLFHLAHYVTGGHADPTPRFPYGAVDKQQFADEFLVSERNVTKEQKNSHQRYVKYTAQICNVHRAWKLLAPIILRRRKDACGEDIVPKVRQVVRVPLGVRQAAVYKFHLAAKYLDKNGKPAIGAKLQALRIAAASPTSALLVRPEHDATPGSPRSDQPYTPKVVATLELIRAVLERGEQALVFSAFNNGLDDLSARLKNAGVNPLVLDGRTSQKRRGELARAFKAGPPRAVAEGLSDASSEYPIMLAGAECMAELHSFHLCNNVVLTAYSWAFDKFEQGINRAHRLNSPWPVTVSSVICTGSIDRKLEAGIGEKKDAAELVLDGHLLGETPAEVNLAELLEIAQREFASATTLDEADLLEGWPRLRSALSQAGSLWGKAAGEKAESRKQKAETVADLPIADSPPPPPPIADSPAHEERRFPTGLVAPSPTPPLADSPIHPLADSLPPTRPLAWFPQSMIRIAREAAALEVVAPPPVAAPRQSAANSPPTPTETIDAFMESLC